EVFRSFIALEEKKAGLPQIQIISRKNSETYFLQYEDPTYVASLGDQAEFDTDWLRFEYESLTTPLSVYEIHMGTKEKRLLKQKEVLGGFQKDHYVSERLFASAPDGTMIPISIVYRKDAPKGVKPLLLYGYGSYGI